VGDLLLTVRDHVVWRALSISAFCLCLSVSPPASPSLWSCLSSPETVPDVAQLEALTSKLKNALQRVMKEVASRQSEEDSKRLCIICVDNNRSIVFTPCGHFCCCIGTLFFQIVCLLNWASCYMSGCLDFYGLCAMCVSYTHTHPHTHTHHHDCFTQVAQWR
jgi:Zinc finger, C3HC4 type (RING finger)